MEEDESQLQREGLAESLGPRALALGTSPLRSVRGEARLKHPLRIFDNTKSLFHVGGSSLPT